MRECRVTGRRRCRQRRGPHGLARAASPGLAVRPDRLAGLGPTASEGDAVAARRREIGRSGSRLTLRGEFDLDDLSAALGAALGAARAGAEGGRVVADLSGVTFMDLRCARELTAWHALRPDLVELRAPSWQAGASLRTCGCFGPPPRRPGPPP